ncbi:MAG: dihydrofolate synthase / folylpolyglutamate synthase [Candidatus Saganbacteria bacterium]|uniref:tetrahydrofolate synthase n=1 Tax=Candidatus Saganbacteria bacterium TaxID=2575572 RepID=A0A833L0G4_UNCSA|nr:MAG: dihydrofolate synthase / folylpolyglutamate synthase [Candidatus Saganbacteria bacterium]
MTRIQGLSLDTQNIKLGLDRIETVLNYLGNPHLKFKSIHIAGTNGKGSVCAMLNSILIEAGYKVGLFTSPHLYKWEERIRVNGENIRTAGLVKRNARISRIAKDLKIELTPFEKITVIAFEYFAEKKVHYAVIEVGLGGRLDATNVITPEVSIVTNIDFDHQEYLGNSIKKIAYEKAGIIKPKIPVITLEKKPEALKVFKKICFGKNAKLLMINPVEKQKSPLIGSHQKANEAAAIEAAKLLKINNSAIDSGLKKTAWPARFQVISKSPMVIVDGAHNVSGMKALVKTLAEIKIPRPYTFIVGFQKYKNIEGILKCIIPIADKLIVTRSENPQAAEIKDIKKLIGNKKAVFADSISSALKIAKKLPQTIMVAGSLFLAAGAIKRFDAAN